MINIDELKEYKKELNLDLGQSELNYIHIAILFIISKYYNNKLIFKGGTCLMLVYNIDRFSTDLDFTLIEEINSIKFLEHIKKELEKTNIKIDYKIEKRRYEDIKIYFYGPLYKNSKRTRCSVRIDISRRKDILLEPNIKKINHLYDEFPVFYIKCMKLEEILAEKVRAIITRNKGRDLYDLNYLINRKTKVDYKLINKKMKIYDQKFSKNLFLEKINLKENIYDKELKNLLKIYPSFKDIKKNIIKYFKLKK